MNHYSTNTSKNGTNRFYQSPKSFQLNSQHFVQSKTPKVKDKIIQNSNQQQSLTINKKNPISRNLLSINKQWFTQQHPHEISTAKSMIFLNSNLSNSEKSSNLLKLNNFGKQINQNSDDSHIDNHKKIFNLQQYYIKKNKQAVQSNFASKQYCLTQTSQKQPTYQLKHFKRQQIMKKIKQYKAPNPQLFTYDNIYKKNSQVYNSNGTQFGNKLNLYQHKFQVNNNPKPFNKKQTVNYNHNYLSVFHDKSSPQLNYAHFVNSPINNLQNKKSEAINLGSKQHNNHKDIGVQQYNKSHNNHMNSKNHESITPLNQDNKFQLKFKSKDKNVIKDINAFKKRQTNKNQVQSRKNQKYNVSSPTSNKLQSQFKKIKINAYNQFKSTQNKQQSAVNTKRQQNKIITTNYLQTKLRKFKSDTETLDINEQLFKPQIKSTFSDEDCNSQNDNSFSYLDDYFESPAKKYFTLNDFQIKQKLGKGAFGQIFVARQIHLGFVCALKKISKKKIKEAKLQQNVIRQIKIQAFLNHKHLTALYGFFDDQDYIYLILQYLTDGSLAQLKRKKKTSEQETVNIVRQVCQGLKYMHSYNIIHRDIKPQNLFVHQNYIKIGDFGCSVVSNALRNTIVGCLDYSSPQQLSNGFYNQKIDVWGVGILVYQLLTTKSPFQADIVQMVRNKRQVNFSRISFPESISISNSGKDFIRKLLNLDPDQRLTIDEALQHNFMHPPEVKYQQQHIFDLINK